VNITNISKEFDTIFVTSNVTAFDSKNKSKGVTILKTKCINGVYYDNTIDILNDLFKESKNLGIKFEGSNNGKPGNLNVGDTLNSNYLKISFKGEGVGQKIFNSILFGVFYVAELSFQPSSAQFNTIQKVEAIENITTPASTFECYKITFETSGEMISALGSKMGKEMNTSGIVWYAKGVGMVKSETYDADRKSMGYSVLTAFKK
jgi:hypothetical protein